MNRNPLIANPQEDARLVANPMRRQLLLTGAAMTVAGLASPNAWAQPNTTPKHGGTLRLSVAGTPDSLDPQVTNSSPGNQVSGMIFDNLTTLLASGEAAPMLATSWHPEKDALEWVFDLRQGVRFHHGTEFTSNDVVTTIQRAYDPVKPLRAEGAFGPLKEVRAEGKYRVRIVLKQPLVELPVVAAGRWARIIPADRVAELTTKPSGTGPFVFGSFETGHSVSVVRNQNYWMMGKPYLDGVRLIALRDAVAQQSALRAKEVDIITQIPIETYLSVRNLPGIKAYQDPTGQYQCLITQANIKPFDNPKVREAFRYLIDRNLLKSSALLGTGVIGNDMPMAPNSPHAIALPQYSQDIPKAQTLLKQAGIGPFRMDIWTTSDRPPSPKIALAVKDGAQRAGITLDIHDVPFTEYVANVSRKKPLYTVQWSAYPTLYESIYLMYRSGANWNYGGVEAAPGLDQVLDTMISEVDPVKRKQAMDRALTSIHSSGERIIPYFPSWIGATNDKVVGFTPPRYDVIDLRSVWLNA